MAAVRCTGCNDLVYPLERLNLDNKPFHRQCAKCSHCQQTLNLGTFASLNGQFFCKTHYLEKFKASGGKYTFAPERPKSVNLNESRMSQKFERERSVARNEDGETRQAESNASAAAKGSSGLGNFLRGGGESKPSKLAQFLGRKADDAKAAILGTEKPTTALTAAAVAPNFASSSATGQFPRTSMKEKLKGLTPAERLAMFTASSIEQEEKKLRVDDAPAPAKPTSKPPAVEALKGVAAAVVADTVVKQETFKAQSPAPVMAAAPTMTAASATSVFVESKSSSSLVADTELVFRKSVSSSGRVEANKPLTREEISVAARLPISVPLVTMSLVSHAPAPPPRVTLPPATQAPPPPPPRVVKQAIEPSKTANKVLEMAGNGSAENFHPNSPKTSAFRDRLAQYKDSQHYEIPTAETKLVDRASEEAEKLKNELYLSRKKIEMLEEEVMVMRARVDLSDAGKEALVQEIIRLNSALASVNKAAAMATAAVAATAAKTASTNNAPMVMNQDWVSSKPVVIPAPALVTANKPIPASSSLVVATPKKAATPKTATPKAAPFAAEVDAVEASLAAAKKLLAKGKITAAQYEAATRAAHEASRAVCA